MPKPVKKTAAKKKPAKPSSDPNRRAKQLMDEHLGKVANSQPPWAKDFKPAGFDVHFGPETEHEVTATPTEMEKFEAMYRAKMQALGKKGGKIGGKRRLEMMTPAKRKQLARNASRARWGNG